jgi:hypothetical protein
MDIVERLRLLFPDRETREEAADEIEDLRIRVERRTYADAEYNFNREKEIERLRAICKELLQHAEYLLFEIEKAKEKDVTLLQTRILRARAALKEKE